MSLSPSYYNFLSQYPDVITRRTDYSIIVVFNGSPQAIDNGVSWGPCYSEFNLQSSVTCGRVCVWRGHPKGIKRYSLIYLSIYFVCYVCGVTVITFLHTCLCLRLVLRLFILVIYLQYVVFMLFVVVIADFSPFYCAWLLLPLPSLPHLLVLLVWST